MIVSKNIPFIKLMKWSGHHFIWLFLYVGTITFLYTQNIINISIPWLPISVIGTAVAFYVGFKNSQSYDRLWEARKIWGSIINYSRIWGIFVDGYITNIFTNREYSETEIYTVKKRLIYRHIAWTYAHRSQLLMPAEWEHISQKGHIARTAKKYQQEYGIGLIDDGITENEIEHYLPEDERNRLINMSNTATQIINEQSRDLTDLRIQGLIDDFRHIEMEKMLGNLLEAQGKNERIKNFPFPRQYANMSRYFTGIFIFLLPFSMIPELSQLGTIGITASVFITVLVAWIYIMMEVVGDYSENPFQGMSNDIPMYSLCRTIEIDLLQMLNEKDIPKKVKSVDDILM